MTRLELKYLPAGKWAAWSAFFILLITYWLTVAPTVSYWDCPEYVAGARGLEVGHPPGNPLWMLVERVVTMFVPARYAALAINLSSGLFTAFAAFFLALTLFRVGLWVLLKLPRRRIPAPLAAAGAALTGALAFGWCDSAWYSAVEAEVYAMSIFMSSLCIWLMCKWAGTRSRTDSWRLLVLIAYIFGLSIGVHQLNLLCIPALAMVWAVRRGIRSPLKLAIIFLLSLIVVGCVLVCMMPSTIALAAEFELLCVNTLHWPMLSGVVIYVLALGAALVMALVVTRLSTSRIAMAAVCWPAIFLSGIFCLPGHFTSGAIISALVAILLVWGKNFKARRLTLSIWMLAFLLAGYSCYALVPLRGDIPSPANAAMPGNPFSFASYQNREQYGSKPLLYGATPFSRPLLQEKINPDSTASYPRYAVQLAQEVYLPKIDNARLPQADFTLPEECVAANDSLMTGDREGYINRGRRFTLRTTPELNMWFPRITGTTPSELRSYEEWIGMDSSSMVSVNVSEVLDTAGRPCGKLMPDGTRSQRTSLRPTYLQNLQWLLSYQTGYMYWRYLLWNFSGRQNDRPSQGEVQHGNFITGFSFIDDAMLGPQSKLPATAGSENPGRNRYFLLPLILGIIGMIWLLKSRRRGMQTCAVTAILFIMTGLAITVYLNQGPGEPRERDYSFLGSFWAYCIWIGFGALAIARRCRSMWGFIPGLAIVIWMGYENFDDHNRSGRTAARDVTIGILQSLEPNAIIFVYGDNATFPFWYAQEVEGVRRDVRVVSSVYLRSPIYTANLQRDWRESPALPFTLKSGDIYYGAFRAAKIGNSPDTLEATEALLALRDSDKPSFPGRYVNLRVAEDSIVTYDLAQLRTGGSSADFGNLMMFDIIATNAAQEHPRPIYWISSIGTNRLIGLLPYTTPVMFGSRFGILPDSRLDTLEATALKGIIPINEGRDAVYMDHIPASQIAFMRAGIAAAGLRALHRGNLALAIRLALKADNALGHDSGSYGTVLAQHSAFDSRRGLADLLIASADSIMVRYPDSKQLQAFSFELKARGRRLNAQSDSLRNAWHSYRQALPPRLQSKMAPTY